MPANPFPFAGLTDAEVSAARAKHGLNTIEEKSGGAFWPAVKGAVLEPMFLLLLATSIIYFVLGERTEAYFMAGAIVLVGGVVAGVVAGVVVGVVLVSGTSVVVLDDSVVMT